MILKHPLPKKKLKSISNKDVLLKISKNEKINKSILSKLFKYRHQKLHQLYSKDDNHRYNEDDEKYTNFFSQMKKYNKEFNKNKVIYLDKKIENENFLKEYFKFQKNEKKICSNEIHTFYGELIGKYRNKNLEFSNKFLSGETLFKESGLLMTTLKQIDYYYSKEAREYGRNNQKTMRDIFYINQLFNILEEQKQKCKSVEARSSQADNNNEYLRRKSCVADMLDKFMMTNEYKRMKIEEDMAMDKIVRMKQKKIEEDKNYIKNISKLIEKEENDKNSGNENENENTLFIINRYANNKMGRNNNNYNLHKNKSSNDILSTFYKEIDTTNSTFLNNDEKKVTFFGRNLKNKSCLINSSKTIYPHLGNKNNENIFIKDNSSQILNKPKNQKSLLKNSSTQLFGKSKSYMSKSYLNNKSNDISSTYSRNNNNMNINGITTYTNLSFKNNKSNLNNKEKNKDVKINIKSVNIGLINKKEIKTDLYKNYLELKYKLASNNNKRLKNFCSTFSTLPKIFDEKINKSFLLDKEIKESHQKYLKLLMESKIKNSSNNNDL